MHDTGRIIAGLVVFLAIVTSPMWYRLVKGGKAGAPELRVVKDSTQCVADTSYMRVLHMDLLDNWRDEAVRDGDRLYVGLGGKKHDKSLSGTCMSCHSSRKEFCDRCHGYVGVKLYCWDCHLEPKVTPPQLSGTRIRGRLLSGNEPG
jgi:hypothetical protein